MQTINKIKNHLDALPTENLQDSLQLLKNDKREGVQKLIIRYQKKYNSYVNEMHRIKSLWHFEEKFYDKGIYLIGGVDEVGRGPLAGPVAASVVILPKGVTILDINDSKKLNAQKRQELYLEIKEKAIAIGIGLVDVKTIDEINILNATLKAMEIAINNLSEKPQQLLVDAVTIPNIKIPQKAIIKGDEKSISIAAASIIAKVTRDKLMEELDNTYPVYGFAQNKGYGTGKHIDAIKTHGICAVHRLSFVKNIV